MVHILRIPENVMIQHLLPYLDHNDLLRLRRVSKQTKVFADAYLWTPQPGHQGNWELTLDWGKEEQRLEAFLQLGLPPPSRLHIVNNAENGPSYPWSIFENEHLEIFLERYGKFVTKLKLDKLFFPFTSAKEIGFYESLVNLEGLCCTEMITVGGTAKFAEKTRRAEGSFLIRPSFKKLKVFKLECTDSTDSMWNFINGVSSNLEKLLHPFQCQKSALDVDLTRTYFIPVRELIERREMKGQSKLVYDWKYLFRINNLELLRVFASCHDNGVIIKNLGARRLDCLLCDVNGRMANRDEVLDPITQEWMRNSTVNYQRNLFVGNVIHSLAGVTDNVFLMEMPALKDIRIHRADYETFQIYPKAGVGYPQWPNLKKMYIWLDHCSEVQLDFFCGWLERPKLEELSLTYGCNRNVARPERRLPFPRNLGTCCANLKKLTISYPWTNDSFLRLWEGLGLLEDVTLYNCWKLTNKGFVGKEGAGTRPVFLKLEKLKHLTIGNIEAMPRITDTVFKKVFRHLKLSSFTLSSDRAIKSITIAGIKELLTGSCADTINKLGLDQLQLEAVSEEELKQVISLFRCSKMM